MAGKAFDLPVEVPDAGVAVTSAALIAGAVAVDAAETVVDVEPATRSDGVIDETAAWAKAGTTGVRLPRIELTRYGIGPWGATSWPT